jgi:hypothetical protein
MAMMNKTDQVPIIMVALSLTQHTFINVDK